MAEPSAGSRAPYRIMVIVGLVGLGLWATYDYWGGLFANASAPGNQQSTIETKAKPKRGVPVLVDAVGEQRDETVIEAIGTARAIRSVTLFSETEGEVVAFPIESGARLSRNDVVMRLDSRDAQLNVRVAQIRVKEAESALDRATNLRDKNVRSKANVEDAEFILERAKLELEQAREALADRSLRAPFDGIVGIPKVEVGDRVTRSSEIITIDYRSTLLVEVEVAERFLSRISLGMPLSGKTPSLQDRDIDGRIVKIDSRVDPVSRTVLVRAAFDNLDDSLRPGMSIFVNLPLKGELFTSVPELSLQWNSGQSYVWRIVDGKSERVPVALKRRLNDIVLVQGELSPGDVIVVEGVQRLRDGRQVEISAIGDAGQ